MKPALLRSALIGLVVMVLIIILGGMGYVGTKGDFEGNGPVGIILYLIFFVSCLAGPIGLPLLLLVIALITWWRTRHLSKDLSVSEAKKQLMYSVWISTAVASFPILVSAILMVIFPATSTSTDPGAASGKGMAMFFAMILFAWNAFLIFMIGVVAQLMVKNDKPKETLS